MEKISEHLEKANANDEYFWGAKFLGFEEWWPGRHMNLQLVSPYLHHLSSHYPYEDWCTVNHPTLDKFKCAMVYSYFKKHDDYDRIMDFDRSFFGYHDDVEQKQPMIILRNTAKYILYFGLFLHLLQIRLNK